MTLKCHFRIHDRSIDRIDLCSHLEVEPRSLDNLIAKASMILGPVDRAQEGLVENSTCSSF